MHKGQTDGIILAAELGGSLQRQRIDVVIGTRPEAIKCSPVARALAAIGLSPRLILTGQHRLRLADHKLSGFDRVRLHCRGRDDPDEHVEAVARAIAPVLADRPDVLIVQGDTSSAMGGALAGFAAGIPVAHVEAGLRSFDPAMPWPEEGYRTAIDARADLLFAPTEDNAGNLRREGVPGEIHVTGNSGIDALMESVAALPTVEERRAGAFRLLVTCHRRENWDRLPAIANAIHRIAADERILVDIVLHPNPTVRDTLLSHLDGHPRIRLLEPLDHLEMIDRMRLSDVLLSDSGGVQEEAPALGVPLLVLREKTERPEGVASGNMLLVGTDEERIVTTVQALTDPHIRGAMSKPAYPFGDGQAGPRIAGHLSAFLARSTKEAGEARRA